jgi:hypothetical protein
MDASAASLINHIAHFIIMPCKHLKQQKALQR